MKKNKKKKSKKETCHTHPDDLIRWDGFNKAIIGATDVWSNNTRIKKLVYDANLMVEVLMERDGMTEEMALEYIDFNIEGAYIGEGQPLVLWKNFSLFGHIFNKREKNLKELIERELSIG